MSNNKKGKQPSTLTSKVQLEKRRALWDQPVEDWVRLLNSIGAQKVSSTRGGVKLCCPFHNDSHPSARIYCDRGYFKCFTLSCNKFTDDIGAFIQKITQCNYADALILYKQHFSLGKDLTDSVIEDLSKENVLRKRLQLLADVVHEYLCSVWQNPNVPEKTKEAVKYLRDTRGIQDVQAITSLGLLPRTDILENSLITKTRDPEDILWIKRFIGQYLTTQYLDCLVFVNADAPDDIVSFKLRKPVSGDQKVIHIVRPDEYQDRGTGFFGLLNVGYSALINNDKYHDVAVVEGEFDQLALYQEQAQRGQFDEIFVSAGGSGHKAGLDALASIGLNRVKIIGDNDPAGEEFPIHLLEKTHKASTRIFRWPATLNLRTGGKIDPDGAVKAFGFDAVMKEFLDDNNYKFAPRWAMEVAEEKLKAVHSDDAVQILDTAKNIGAWLNNDKERRAFTELFTKKYNIVQPTDIAQGIAEEEDTPLGFIKRIQAWLLDRFHVISYIGKSLELYLWHKQDQVEVQVSLQSPRTAVSNIAHKLNGGILYTWVKEEIGMPGYLPLAEGPDAVPQAHMKITAAAEYSLFEALRSLAERAADSLSDVLGQGIHLRDVKDADKPGYIVNGRHVYRLMWHEDGKTLKAVTELDGPTDGNVVFDNKIRENDTLLDRSTNKWLPIIDKPPDFFKTPKYGALETFEIIRGLFNKTCEYKYQEPDAIYMSLLVFYTCVFDVFPRKIITHLLGEYESGKTMQLGLVAKHPQAAEYSLTHLGWATDRTTIAGLFQALKNARFMVALDEMNDPNDGGPESKRVSNILGSIRGLATTGMATRTLGTSDQSGRNDRIYCPVIMASGTIIPESMDASRIVTVYMKKNPNKKNTRFVLNAEYGLEKIRDIRDSVFFHMVNLAPAIARERDRLALVYGDGTRLSQQVDRTIDSLLTLAAIGSIIGMDYEQFLLDFTTARKKEKTSEKSFTKGDELLELLCTQPCIPVDTGNADLTVTLGVALTNPQFTPYINSSQSGVFYDSNTRCIGVLWSQARTVVLRGTPHSRQSVRTMLHLSSLSSSLVPEEQAEAMGIVQRLKVNGMIGAREYSVFNVGHMIDEYTSAYAEANNEPDSTKETSDEVNKGGPLSGVKL